MSTYQKVLMCGLCLLFPSLADGFFPWSLGAIGPPSIKQGSCEWLVPVAEEAKSRRRRGRHINT